MAGNIVGPCYVGRDQWKGFCRHGNELDVRTVYFVEFCYVCPTYAQYILTISVS